MTAYRDGRRVIATIAVVAAALCCPAARAQTGAPAPVFASDEEITLTLELPLRSLVRERSERPELDAVLTYAGPDGAATRLDVEVRTRGRNRLRICSFPPLRLDFKRRQVPGTLFDGQNRLKLVTRCRDAANYAQYLELEYSIYRMYEQVSDFAFRVRPVRMRYVDTERNNAANEAPGFLIESIDGVAARAGMTAVELPGVTRAELNPEALVTLELFQYLIGNTDWSVTNAAEGEACCHNVDILASPTGGGLVGVPYDFDNSGIIDAEYALPAEQLGIRTVTQRLYRGTCATNAHLDATIAEFNAARPALEALLQTERLTERSRMSASRYLARSFEILNDPGLRQREIVGKCRG